MARSSAAPAPAQVLLFPYGELAEPGEPSRPKSTAPERGTSVVLCGTYRKDPEGLRRTFERLKDTGFLVLSPSNPFIETEDQGFVYMRHESMQTPHKIEDKHLDSKPNRPFPNELERRGLA